MKVTTKIVKTFIVELTEQEVKEIFRIVREGNASQALAFLGDLSGILYGKQTLEQ